ncbi:MAG: hypothetical protein RBT40_08280 [Petrimonas sp.]|jgi:hypothetical protein|nr:hypothetical protein [Petrimonas sp.]
MEEKAIIELIKQMSQGMTEPGRQTFFIYGLLIALFVALFRIFVINGWMKNLTDKHFGFEKEKLESLVALNEKVLSLHEKFVDLLAIHNAKRRSDSEE